jgi:hypothetical protein
VRQGDICAASLFVLEEMPDRLRELIRRRIDGAVIQRNPELLRKRLMDAWRLAMRDGMAEDGEVQRL